MKANCGSWFEATDYHGMEVMARETWHPCHTVPSQEAARWRLMVSFLSSLELPQLSLPGSSLTDTSRSPPTLPYPVGNSQSHPIDREG